MIQLYIWIVFFLIILFSEIPVSLESDSSFFFFGTFDLFSSTVMSYGMISNQCSCGGRCLSVEYTDRVGELAKKHGLKLHIDGARIFNASVVSKRILNILIYEYCSKLEHAWLYHPSVD